MAVRKSLASRKTELMLSMHITWRVNGQNLISWIKAEPFWKDWSFVL